MSGFNAVIASQPMVSTVGWLTMEEFSTVLGETVVPGKAGSCQPLPWWVCLFVEILFSRLYPWLSIAKTHRAVRFPFCRTVRRGRTRMGRAMPALTFSLPPGLLSTTTGSSPMTGWTANLSCAFAFLSTKANTFAFRVSPACSFTKIVSPTNAKPRL